MGLLGRTGKEGLKRQCTTLDATTINQVAASLADKKYISKHDLESVTDISAGAATFYVWVRSLFYLIVRISVSHFRGGGAVV